MNKIGVGEFVRRLDNLVVEQQAPFAFFLGAGASVSSGIPGAATLTEKWVDQLHQLRNDDGAVGFEEWLAQDLPTYDPDDPAASYAQVMQRRFLTAAERQAEIETIVSGRDPGFGYATLAQFMTRADSGERCNVVITTNFDDLVADALYLYTEKKPLVVRHEALAGFVGARRTRPTVIKLHGDALLNPLNIEGETDALAESLIGALKDELQNRAIVFIGYGGNDTGVLKALQSLPEDSLRWGIYWVNTSVPEGDFGEWLEQRPAIWVEHRDFDELAVLLWERFDLPHPTDARFNRLLDTYRNTFAELQSRSRSDETTAAEVLRAVDDAQGKFANWFQVVLEARKYAESEPDRADEVYRAGIEQFGGSAGLLGSYASFLFQQRKEMDQAEDYYRRAVEANPSHANNLTNYGTFHHVVHKDDDQAVAYFQRALEVDPDHANALCNYAGILLGRGEEEAALAMLRRLESVPEFLLPSRVDLRIEVDFYKFANVAKDADERTRFLKRIRHQLIIGNRSPGWDFSPNLDRARGQGHPELAMLEVLADVIAERTEIGVLDLFETWTSLDETGDS